MLEINKIYELKFPKPTTIVARLIEIESYPASGMPPDYNFKYISGDDSIPKASDKGKLEFLQKFWKKSAVDATDEELTAMGPMPEKIPDKEVMTFALPVALVSMHIKVREVDENFQIISEEKKKSIEAPLSEKRSYEPKPDKSHHSLGILGAEIEKSTVSMSGGFGYEVKLVDEVRIFHKGTNEEGLRSLRGGLSILDKECPKTYWSEIETRESFSWRYIYHEKDALIVKEAFEKIRRLPIKFKRYAGNDALQYQEELMGVLGDQRKEQLNLILKTNKRLGEIKKLIGNIEMFLKAQELPPSIERIFIPKSKAPVVVNLKEMTKEELIEIITSGRRPVLKEVPTYNDKKLGLKPVMTPMFLHFDKEKVGKKFRYISTEKQLLKRCLGFKQFTEGDVLRIASTESYESLCNQVDFSCQIESMLKVLKKELKRTKSGYIGRVTEDIYFNGDRRYTFESA